MKGDNQRHKHTGAGISGNGPNGGGDNSGEEGLTHTTNTFLLNNNSARGGHVGLKSTYPTNVNFNVNFKIIFKEILLCIIW
jgi:hypothetical protein